MSGSGRESKREEFRHYLEKAGVLDALTKVLVGLYEEPEKPVDALEFVKRHLHEGMPEPVDVDSLKQQVQELRERNQQLEEDVAQLKGQLEKYEKIEENHEGTTS